MSVDTVFISYSHDSAEHLARVLALSERLRELGIGAELDRYHVRPSQGWPRWCEEQLRPENSRFVLLLCTDIYRRRVENKVTADEGRGVFWEGGIISQYLYDVKGNNRFILLLLGHEPETSIPLPLRGHTFYRIEAFDRDDPGFDALYRELTGQPAIRKRSLGKKLLLDQVTSMPPDPTEKKPSSSPNPLPAKSYISEGRLGPEEHKGKTACKAANGESTTGTSIRATVEGGAVGVVGAQMVHIENLYVGGATNNPLDEPFQKAPFIQSPAFFFKQGAVIGNFGSPGEQEFTFDGARVIYIRVTPKSRRNQPKVGREKLKTVFFDNRTVKPMSLEIGGSFTRNDDGWISIFPSTNNSTKSITQGFPTGELWGMNSEVFKYMVVNWRGGDEATTFIDAIRAEKICMNSLVHYLDIANRIFELVFPFVAEIGAVELERSYLAAPAAKPNSNTTLYYGPIVGRNLIRYYDIDDGNPRHLISAIHSFFDELYDLADCSHTKLITPELARLHGLQLLE